jgi:vWA-MoxR associated protein C-terminal domain
VQRLGLEYEVVTRWSDRLKRSRMMARAINHATRRLAEITACETVAPVDWLDKHDLADLAQLRAQLVNGRYSKALALASCPRDAEDLMALLLTFSPIVLWPHAVDEFPEDKRNCLVTCWHRMPGEFLKMYRMRWRDQPTGDAGDLRAVWDDEDWLNFCRPFQYGEPGTSGGMS